MTKPFKDLITIILEQEQRRNNFIYVQMLKPLNNDEIDTWSQRTSCLIKQEEKQVKELMALH